MSDASNAAPGGVVNLSDYPGGGFSDATFDQLFPAESQTVVVAPVQQATQTQPEPQTQQTQVAQTTATPAQPFIKGERSVYNSAEAAVKGINEKDALIEQLRQRYALTTGIDPITGQPIAQRGVPQQQDNYYANPEKYVQDLYEATQKGGPQAYRDVQGKFILDALAPMQPYLQRAARDQALEQVTAQIPDAKNVIGTPQYNAALESLPELKIAITAAESNMQWHSRLPELYKTAYFATKGVALPDILKSQAQPVTTQTQTPRPTATSTTMSPPTQQGPKPSFKNMEGIKATIADLEARGAKLEF